LTQWFGIVENITPRPRKYTFVLSPENTNCRKYKFVFLNTIFVEKYKFCINNTTVLLGGAKTLWPYFVGDLKHFLWFYF
jgi:hypothetical protein